MRQFKLSSLATFAACGAFIVQAVRAPRDVTQGSDASTTLTTAEKQSSLSTTTAVISSTGDGTTGADYTTGNSATITSSATGDSTAAANSTSVDSTRTTVTAPAVTGNSSSASNASTPTSTTIASAPLNTSAAGDGGNATSADHLPLQPKITPGLGVAGVVLIIFGAIYGLIGIRQSWIHVFLSAAFLGGLAVSVSGLVKLLELIIADNNIFQAPGHLPYEPSHQHWNTGRLCRCRNYDWCRARIILHSLYRVDRRTRRSPGRV